MTLQMGAVVAFVTCVSLAQTASDTLTLPELAAKSGGRPVTLATTADPPELTLDELSTRAELVVVGKLVNPRAYMTVDQTDVYTDYQLQLVTTVSDRVAISSAKQVGQLSPVTVTLHGGTLLVNGVKVTVRGGGPTKWKPEADLLLFLRKSKSTEKQNNFVLVGSATGLYEVTSAGLKSRVAGSRVHQEIDGAPVEQIVQRVKTVAAEQTLKK